LEDLGVDRTVFERILQ